MASPDTTMDLSLIAQFDEIRKLLTIVADDTAEKEFINFARQTDECLRQWGISQENEQRLQAELERALKTMADLESKLRHARKLLEIESKARREAEAEKEELIKRMALVSDMLQTDHTINHETRSKLDFLNEYKYPRKRKSALPSRLEEQDVNSTGSFLSDLSLTQSEDDFLDATGRGHNKSWKRHRPSLNAILQQQQKKNKSGRRSSSHNIIEKFGNDMIIASTKVSVPQDDGPILARSKIEAIPSTSTDPGSFNQKPAQEARSSKESRPVKETPLKENRSSKDNRSTKGTFSQKDNPQPTPLKETRSSKEADPNKLSAYESIYKTPMKTPSKRTKLTELVTPSAPPFCEIVDNFQTPQTVKRRPGRNHDFTSKTFFRPADCTHCQKRIRFGNAAQRCKNCEVCCHNECADKLDIACVPQSAGTPIHKGIGTLVDFVTPYKPMIPAILIHCIDEIEKRGLSEMGLYRISGAEREVRGLKEKFLRGKGVPCLSNIDVHVICGCVKDFLRTLQEKLIPASMWADFSNAVNSTDEESELKRAVEKLPEANQDTLAFMMQHLQRVGQEPAVKMPPNNLARVFAPTLIGTPDLDHDQHKMYAQAVIQVSIMEKLLAIKTEYWNKFTNLSGSNQSAYAMPNEQPTKDIDFISAPLYRSGKKERKYYATPPYTKSNRK